MKHDADKDSDVDVDINEDANDDNDSIDIDEIVRKIYKRIIASRVLNGGFERLSLKIDHISEKLVEVNDKVDKIHTTIHDPEGGLYSKYKALESWKKTKEDKDQFKDQNSNKFKWLIIGVVLSSLGSYGYLFIEHYLKR
jgi:hypothetical protein